MASLDRASSRSPAEKRYELAAVRAITSSARGFRVLGMGLVYRVRRAPEASVTSTGRVH
jgi:hypothetical protein